MKLHSISTENLKSLRYKMLTSIGNNKYFPTAQNSNFVMQSHGFINLLDHQYISANPISLS